MSRCLHSWRKFSRRSSRNASRRREWKTQPHLLPHRGTALPLACGPIWVASSWVITPPGNPGGHCFIVVRAPLAAAARSSLRFAIASLWSEYASFGHWNLRNFGHVCAKEGQATVDRTLKTEEQGNSDVVGCPLAQCRFSLFPRRDSPA